MNTIDAFLLQEGKAKFWKYSDYVLKVWFFSGTDGKAKSASFAQSISYEKHKSKYK